MRGFLLSASLLFGTLSAGCFADSQVGYSYGYAAPSMVYVGPGIQVVSDYDYPVFYSDSLYWRQTDGIWYSSRYHDRGWGRSYSVPVGVRGIQRPNEYAHYRGNAQVRGGYNNTSGPAVRDHRSAPAAAPVVRDHRAPAPAPRVRDHRH